MAQKQANEKPIPPERCWVKYRLSLRGIRYAEIAHRASRSENYVSQVVCGRRRSERVEAAIAKMLGFASWGELMEIALLEARGARYEPKTGGAA